MKNILRTKTFLHNYNSVMRALGVRFLGYFYVFFFFTKLSQWRVKKRQFSFRIFLSGDKHFEKNVYPICTPVMRYVCVGQTRAKHFPSSPTHLSRVTHFPAREKKGMMTTSDCRVFK